MATEKVTPMVLKVDLQCHCCYKKIKKTLCKFPQVRDQIFDVKNNTVTIIVVCCSPEKIRDKLCYKAGKVIKSIEIKDAPSKPKAAAPDKPKAAAPEPDKKPKEAPKPQDKPKDAPKLPDKPKEGGGGGGGDKPKVVVIEKPKEAEKPKVTFVDKPPEKPKDAAGPPKPAGKPKADGPPPPAAAAEKPKEAPPKAPEPAAKGPPPAGPVKGPEPVIANGVPSVFPYVGPTYDEYSAGPYYHGYGFPPPPQPGYYVCGEPGYGYGYGHGHGHGPEYGYGRPVYATRGDNYFSEENQQGCSIM